MIGTPSARRRKRRYLTLLVLVALLFGGWSGLWYYAVGKTEAAVQGWRAREAKSGRIYACGSQSIGGYPFRFELNCDNASALLPNARLPLEIKARGMLFAAQIYQPDLLISEIHGPLTIAAPGQPPEFVVNWKLFQSSLRGTPAAPERVSLVFDKPAIDRMAGAAAATVFRAQHAEIHGRVAEGSALSNPVIEIALRLSGALAPEFKPAATQPVNADVDMVLRGLADFSPKPWPERFRQMQAAGGRIDIKQARVEQGETIAVGGGSLSINAGGRLEGELRLTIAGLEPFLESIGAKQMVQNSRAVDKLAGVLDRLSPGLGSVARQQAGENISAGINLIGEQTTLEGKRAVSLPLRIDDGRMFLGPIPIGTAPALF